MKSIITRKLPNLVVVDTKALQFFVADVATKTHKIQDTNMFQQYTDLNLYYLLSGAWLHDKSETVYVFANDSKPYWRHYELNQRYGVNYKGNRNKQGQRDLDTTLVGSCLEQFLGQRGLLTLKYADFIAGVDGYDLQLGYEADDIASYIVQTQHKNYNNIYLLTVDTDWLPLTIYPNVIWLNMKTTAPRIRDAATALQTFQNTKYQINTTEKRQYASRMTSVLDIWKFKAYFGDSSDNIRGNKKDQCVGRYDSYIDLLNPLPSYNLTNHPLFNELVNNYTSNLFTTPKSPISNQEWQAMTKGSLPIAVPPLSLEDTTPYLAV